LKRLIPIVALAAGCAVVPQPDSPIGPDPRVEPAPRLPAQEAEARSLEEYKQQVAHAILHANAEHTFIGRLPEVLKSVVVLQVEIDRHGFAYGVKLFRSNGYKDLEARAIQSVRAGSLPRPGGGVTGGHGYVSFTETWLFRDDGKFQIRTLAGPQ